MACDDPVVAAAPLRDWGRQRDGALRPRSRRKHERSASAIAENNRVSVVVAPHITRNFDLVHETFGTMQYIRGYDGLRALAVLAVIAFHLHLPGASLGWTGVVLFFVLSGFLITRILMATKAAPDYLSSFFRRRALRILPIYYLCFLAIIAIAFVGHRSISDWSWYATYLQNWRLAETRFAPDFTAWFAHTWSLACEEQFYFVWPFIILAVRGKWLTGILTGFIAVGVVSRIVAVVALSNPYAAFAPLTSVVDMLAWGALSAVLLAKGNEHIRQWSALSFISLIGITVALAGAHGIDRFWLPEDHLMHLDLGMVFFALLGPLFASLILLVYSSDGSMLVRSLELPPLRYIGRISYGLYSTIGRLH